MIGCIADDYTGGTDVAAGLRRCGLRTVLLFGVPGPSVALPPDCDAVVVALKTRTIPAADAIEQSRRVQRWLGRHGAGQVYFKYCSTFDSTDDGNIGPVTDALLDQAGSPMTLICPASPEHGRTVYQGHLFVNGVLLSESPMRDHPLTPMKDPDLVRVLSRQTPHRVGLLPLDVIRTGDVSAHLEQLRADGIRHVVVDATQDDDLIAVVAAVADLPVLTGGAGLAGALAASRARSRAHQRRRPVTGPGIVLAGSCSAATLQQVAHARAVFPSYRLDPAVTPEPGQLLHQAETWLEKHLGDTPVLIYSSAQPEQRVAGAAELLEHTLGTLARTAVWLGARRIVVAGGETSGAVVNALGIDAVEVTDEADRGVPWCRTAGTPPLELLLKSGNFGRPDLLVRSMEEV
ncbi:HPr kinase [Actinoplanes italicus]|uniref:3-oxo-tetronate kinase n=1 Tax=Actinoplanes italicus TaxID=113567 RepID=A0A2T0K079_9ACTN|nr:3-oxo-tetronate kinase [Actinoplanes italicus]PRX15932.1 uncharacterized protein YgbK (DUF1537 family) [Actinoplanes italicus]GIE28732.1 HPr kinase [Actinoplanes italicus]